MRVAVIDESQVVCCNSKCRELGVYANCYLHTNIYCPVFKEWQASITERDYRKLYERGEKSDG